MTARESTSSVIAEEGEDLRNSKKLKKLVNPWNWYPQTWNKIFVASCVLAVIFDPLFLYVPTINSEKKCLAIDDRMNTVALALRALTDLASLIHLFLRIQNAHKMARELRLSIFTELPWSHLVINIIAILPIPQVVMTEYFSKLAGSESLSARKFLNALLTLQYAPRLIRVYLSAKEVGSGLDSLARHVSVRGAFFFIHYIIFGHIFGALWYFYAIFRETACWHEACKNIPGCDESISFNCRWTNPIGNMTYNLSNFCPVDPPNSTVFDFGIFSDAMESGILRETGFPTKLSRSFWWGLSNLSSFGQNLETTSNVYENLFAVLISILGLLLFLYLIGNLQTYMQLATTKSAEARRKISVKLPEIDSFLANQNLPPHKKKVVIQYLQHTIKHDNDFDIKRLLALLQERSEHGQNDGESFSTWVNKILDVKRHDKNTLEVKAMFWIARNEIGAVEKKKILRYVRLRLTEGNDVNFENLLPILPSKLGLSIKKFLCFPILKKVSVLENLDDYVYEMICTYAKPVIYAEKSYVIRKDEPVDFMLLVTQGILLSFGDETTPTKRILRGEFWGVEMLEWRLRTTSYSELPMSKSNLKCHTKVEGFALMAVDLEHVLSNCWAKFSMSEGLKPFAEASLEKGLRRYIRNRRDRANNNQQLSIVMSST